MAPRSHLESHLVDIWQEVLQVERVGIRDNFFELGGHSLLATQVISRIREREEVDVPLALLFQQPQIEGLAEAIEKLKGEAGEQLSYRIPHVSRENVDTAFICPTTAVVYRPVGAGECTV